MAAVARGPLGSPLQDRYQRVTVQDAPTPGAKILLRPDGQIISVDPKGIVGLRPPGSEIGLWERCVLQGSLAVYQPEADSIYLLAFCPTLPNE